jgi:hypothetical protein
MIRISSWPGVAVRRTASLPLAYARPSTSFAAAPAKTWMPGTSPGKTSFDMPSNPMRSEFSAADFFQRRQIGLHQLPQDRCGDTLVAMAQYVADSRNFLPRDFWIARFQLIRKMTTGFGNDLNTALDEPLPCQSFSNASSDTSANTPLTRSIASMMSVKRGMSERAITKTRGRLLLRSLPGVSCAGCHAS